MWIILMGIFALNHHAVSSVKQIFVEQVKYEWKQDRENEEESNGGISRVA